MKQNWFEQMFLSWTGCPALEGQFETGCHTSAGNELVLYMTTTKRFNEWYRNIIETTWYYFSTRKGSGLVAGRQMEPLFPKEGISIDLKYDILNAGMAVPTYIGRHTYPKVKALYKEMLVQYQREIGEPLEDTDENTIRDVQNWIMRQLNVWMNENKRSAQ